MSYTFDDTYRVAGTSEWKPATSTNFWMGLALEGTQLSGTGAATVDSVTALSSLNECNYANYARQKLNGVNTSADSSAHLLRWKFDPVTFTNLGTATTPVVGAFIYQGTSSTGKLRHWFDTSPLFPFVGTGNDKVIVAPTGGAVRIGGN